MNSIIADELSLDNFFNRLKVNLFLTKPQEKHLKDIMKAMVSIGFHGKVSDVSKFTSQKHRTSITRFFSKSPWKDALLLNSLKSFVVELIWRKSRDTKKPIYFIIDDTISEKTLPSSKAANPIETCSFHNSHLKGKTVYGHQILVSLLVCDGLVLPYSIDIYDKKCMSKIEMSKQLIRSLPKPYYKGYVLGDSWYSCKSIFESSQKSGYTYLGALKTNRVVYPQNYTNLGIKLHQLGISLSVKDFDLVTVKGQEYYIYSYVGSLKDIKKVTIVLSYPKEAFQKEGALKTFISLDTSLQPLDILIQYTERWAIEPFFRDCKTNLGLNGYQMRSEKSINRYLLALFMNYLFCKLHSKSTQHFNIGFQLLQNKFRKENILWIYNAALKGKPIEHVFKYLKIA